MLDLFSNVFGKSKKSTNGRPSSDKDETGSLDKSSNIYPTILLTDQMLKGESNLSKFEIVETPSTIASNSRTTFKLDDSVIASSNNRQKTFSPLDNIPFHISSTGEHVDNNLTDLNECFTLLNSVASYLTNPSSEYKFGLEKTMIMN